MTIKLSSLLDRLMLLGGWMYDVFLEMTIMLSSLLERLMLLGGWIYLCFLNDHKTVVYQVDAFGGFDIFVYCNR